MSLSVMAINPGHNGSCALVVDGKVIYYSEEERLSRQKYDGNPFRGMLEVLTSTKIDICVIGGTAPQNNLAVLPWTNEDAYKALVRKFQPDVKFVYAGGMHHLGHASSAFYGSGFKTAVAVVVDGSGTFMSATNENGNSIADGFETESIYLCSYPNNIESVYKRLSDGRTKHKSDDGKFEFVDHVTITKAYEAVTDYLGFGFIEAGKTMGLSPYGAENPDIPDFFIGDKGNKNLLIPNYPAGAFIDNDTYPKLKMDRDASEWHQDFSKVTTIEKDIAYKIQKETEQQVMNLIQKAIDLTGEKNVVLSGGFALNCVANYKYLKKFPDINFYVDPIAHDGGTSVGLAKYVYHDETKSEDILPLTTLYLAKHPDYMVANEFLQDNPDKFEVVDATSDSVADLIIDGNIICIFQGQAEGGPRALGNRSIIFDPRVKDGKDIVNGVKKREWFRPFAGTILEEHASEWFEMENLKSSPFMMYAIKVKDDKIEQIPAITHVDGTCRIQTVNQDQNEKYFELISKFHEKTGVPILFNTSFNLAGEPLVETLADAINTLMNSELKYLYLAEHGKMIVKK